MTYFPETNALEEEIIFSYHTIDREPITLKELADAHGQITRVRMFREAGYTDVSYIYGELPDGTHVRIWDTPDARYMLPVHLLLAWAKEEGVYAKGIGLLNSLNWSILG